MANAGVEERGAIFTRQEVINFILDLVGYTVDEPLHERRALEPSFGGGDFLLALTGRLITSYRRTAEPTQSPILAMLSGASSYIAIRLRRPRSTWRRRSLAPTSRSRRPARW